jgi:hypothetical protein
MRRFGRDRRTADGPRLNASSIDSANRQGMVCRATKRKADGMFFRIPLQTTTAPRLGRVERFPGILALRESAGQGKVHNVANLGVTLDGRPADAAQEFIHV